MTAPTCPVSFSELQGPPREWFADLVNSIPRAHDLPSAIRALSIINNVMTVITHGGPAVNNVTVPGGDKTTVPGSNQSPYPAAPWTELSRAYKTQRLENPDNPDQFIEIKVLNYVKYQSEAHGSSMFVYEGAPV